MKKVIKPGTIPTKDLHQYMIGAIAPRPIAFVTTIDDKGIENIAPYSFFNAFSSNPPIVVFSSNRRVSNNTTKDTLSNIKLNAEVVVNVVNYNIVRQMSIASAEYPHEISEFDKSGLTKEKSEEIRPSLIKESPVNMECRVKDIITLGDQGGAGHLIICDVLLIHIDESILDGNRIDPNKIDLMGRMGRTFYVRASGDALISIYQPVTDLPVGFDALPTYISKNKFLTGNEIALMASGTELPQIDQNEMNNPVLQLDEKTFTDKVKLLLQENLIQQAYSLLHFYYER